MTTVAVDETGLVAADTQLTAGNYALHVSKLFRMTDGSVITGCGAWSLIYARIQWHLDGEGGDPPDIRGGDIVIVKPDGTIWVGEGDCPVYPIMDRSIAIGCGRDLARSALARGKSALEAVQEAVGLDCYSGEPVQSMRPCYPQEMPGLEPAPVTKKNKRA